MFPGGGDGGGDGLSCARWPLGVLCLLLTFLTVTILPTQVQGTEAASLSGLTRAFPRPRERAVQTGLLSGDMKVPPSQPNYVTKAMGRCETGNTVLSW